MEELKSSAASSSLSAHNSPWTSVVAQVRKHKFTAFIILGLIANGSRHVVGPSTVRHNHHLQDAGIDLNYPETSNAWAQAAVRGFDRVIAERVKEISDPNVDPILRDYILETNARLMGIQDRLRHFPSSENWLGIAYATGKTLSLIAIDAAIDYPKRMAKGTFLAARDFVKTAGQEGFLTAYSKMQTGIIIGINSPIGSLLSIFSQSGKNLVGTLPPVDGDLGKFAVGIGEIMTCFALNRLRGNVRSLVKAPFRRRRRNAANAPTYSP